MSDESEQQGLGWSLQITEDRQGGVVVLEVKGRIGAVSTASLASAIGDVIARGDHHLVIDLGQVDYLSSAGLEALEAAADRCIAAGGAFVLCAVAHPVQMVLTLAGLLSHFAIESSRERAIERAAPNHLA